MKIKIVFSLLFSLFIFTEKSPYFIGKLIRKLFTSQMTIVNRYPYSDALFHIFTFQAALFAQQGRSASNVKSLMNSTLCNYIHKCIRMKDQRPIFLPFLVWVFILTILLFVFAAINSQFSLIVDSHSNFVFFSSPEPKAHKVSL